MKMPMTRKRIELLMKYDYDTKHKKPLGPVLAADGVFFMYERIKKIRIRFNIALGEGAEKGIFGVVWKFNSYNLAFPFLRFCYEN